MGNDLILPAADGSVPLVTALLGTEVLEVELIEARREASICGFLSSVNASD